MRAETPRQLVHIGAGAVALALRWLTWPQAAGLAVAAVLFNVFVLPRLSRRLFRDGDLDHPWSSGIALYPFAVFGLVLVFRSRLDLVAAAWAILAAGDGMATLVGTTVRTRPLPWNPDKSLGGLLAFVLSGSMAAAALLAWTNATPITLAIVTVACLAALVAGFVETVPIRLNDNVSVPVAAALVLWSCSHVEAETLAATLATLPMTVALGLGLNAVVAALGWRTGTVTLAGAVTGLAIGAVIFVGAGWPGWILLLATFLVASACTRAGMARKVAAGIAEDRGGRRGPGNAIANTGIAAWAAAIAVGLPDPALALLAMVASLATAGSDTVASEIGKAFGRTTWLVVGFRRVPPGTSGAVSLEGTLAGIAAAALLASIGAAGGLIPVAAILVVVLAATLASLVEGALGATMEARGILNNDALNFVNAGLGAGLALIAWTIG